MSKLKDLADRVERLLLRHDELQRTRELLEQQLAVVVNERDSLRSRLSAARSRIDALLERLPVETTTDDPAVPGSITQGEAR
jgi:chromosome segregation ATPase